MNELTGRYVNVVLAVEESKGMEFLKHPVQIVANFNGRVLESDLSDPEECPIFNTELVWETEKKDLRKIRSSSIPLRVECFAVDTCGRKDRVGFALLSLRSAHIIPMQEMRREIPFTWQKLLGVAHEFKSCHPELYLSLSIRDHLLNEATSETLVYVPEQTIEEEQGNSEDSTENTDRTVIPIRYLEDGFIQIGDDSDLKETYSLTITVRIASNLDVLLPEVLVFQQNKEKYYISFTMFGITIKSKPFSKDLHDNIALNEKIITRLISSFEILHLFFLQYHHVNVSFHCGRDKLGTTKINIQNLVSDITEEDFYSEHQSTLRYEENCFFNFPSPNGIVPEGSDGRKPYIEVQTVLERPKRYDKNGVDAETGDGEPHNLRQDKSPPKTITSSLDKPNMNAAGDKMADSATDVQEISPRWEEIINTTETEECVLASRKFEKVHNYIETYQQYCLDIILEKITWRKPMSGKVISILFKHPKASTLLTSKLNLEICTDEDVILEDARCKLYIVSTPEEVRKIVYAWPPVLCIVDDKEQNITEELEMYTAMFLAKDKKECSYSSELKLARTYEELAKISISMYLQEYGMKSLPRPTGYDLEPAIVDEKIAIKELQELQQWKETQKRKFEEDLLIVENKHVNALKAEWAQRKAELEDKLCKSVTKCKSLSLELQRAADEIRAKNEFERKQNEIRAKMIYNFDEEVQKNAVKYSTCPTSELIEKICKLECENENLKQIIAEQRKEIQQNKKTALTKEQTTNLLQELRVLEEKFEEAQNAKTYFKEQWKTAVREIHDLRSEDQKQIQSQIQNNKEELSQLSLDSLFGGRKDESMGVVTNYGNYDFPCTNVAANDKIAGYTASHNP